MEKFKLCVRIGDDVTSIMKLRCVSFVGKNTFFPEYAYHLYPGLMHDYKEDLSHRHIARKGEWLCEDYDGHWHILSDEQMRKTEDYSER